MISSMSLSNLATIRPPREGGGTYIGDLGSKTFENFRLSGQKEMTESERGSVLEEIRPVIMALHGFKMAGISDPLAAAREAVKGTQQRQFDTRNAALGDAVKSISVMARAASAEQSSRGNIASAEAVRDGASDSLLSSINHIVAKEELYIGQLFGKMSVTAAMLERDFTVTGNILGRDEQGATSLGGFELSHKTFGKLLSVDAEGVVTLFDQGGGAMDQATSVKTLFGGSGPFAGQQASAGSVVDRWM